MKNDFKIGSYRQEDLIPTVKVWRKSYEHALGIKSLHTFEEQCYFLAQILTQEHQLYVATDESGNIAGFLAQKSEWIDQLYIAEEFQHKGLGHKFIEQARENSPNKLRCYTFQKNVIARHFYEKNGFVEISKGSTKNEEGLPDVLLEWSK